MFRPMQLSSGNSAAGQFYKGRSKAHKQLSAFHRPVEKRGQNSGQQLAVDANGTVSHSAVVAFLTGPAQMMLVHEAVQHSLRFGQQLAGNQVTLPCKPRDWAMVKLPPLEPTTETEAKTIKIKATPKQPYVLKQACSTPASSLDVSAVPSINQANTCMPPSNAAPCSDADAAIAEVATLSATEPKGASTSLSTPTSTTTTPLFDNAISPMSPATSTALPTLEEANSSNLCENSLADTAVEDTEWTTCTWTYQDAFEDYEAPKPSASILSHNTVISTSTTENHSSTESAPVNPFKATSNYQGMDASSSMDVFVEVSLLDKHKATKAQPSLTTSASQQENSWSTETLHDSLSAQPDTNTHITPSRPSFGSQPLKTTCVQALNTPCMPNNNSVQVLAIGSPSGVEAQCQQQPTGSNPCSSTPTMQLSMAAGATSYGAVKGTLALRGKLARETAGLGQSLAEKLRSLYCWRPAAWAW